MRSKILEDRLSNTPDYGFYLHAIKSMALDINFNDPFQWEVEDPPKINSKNYVSDINKILKN